MSQEIISEYSDAGEIAARIRQVRRHLRLPQQELAAKMGVAVGTLNRYENDAREPSPSFLRALAQLDRSINAGWLLTGEGSMLREAEGGTRLGEFDYVINYEVWASAGPGAEVEDAPGKSVLAFRREWLKSYLGAPVQELFGLTVDGESMEPTLHNRDTILVDRTKAQSKMDGIYVIRDEGTLKVKRLAFQRGKRIVIISDNSAYPQQTIDEGAPDFAILGRVVWVGRTIAAGN